MGVQSVEVDKLLALQSVFGQINVDAEFPRGIAVGVSQCVDKKLTKASEIFVGRREESRGGPGPLAKRPWKRKPIVLVESQVSRKVVAFRSAQPADKEGPGVKKEGSDALLSDL